MEQRIPVIEPAALEEGGVSFEQFCTLIGDGQKADLIDGGIYVASPDSRRSNNLTRFLTNLLDDYLDARNIGGEVFVTRFAFRVSETNAPEPDVAYVRPQ